MSCFAERSKSSNDLHIMSITLVSLVCALAHCHLYHSLFLYFSHIESCPLFLIVYYGYGRVAFSSLLLRFCAPLCFLPLRAILNDSYGLRVFYLPLCWDVAFIVFVDFEIPWRHSGYLSVP